VSGALDRSKLLRAGLLDGVSVLVVGGRDGPFAGAVETVCAELGARVLGRQPGVGEEEPPDALDVLVFDAAAQFACASADPNGDDGAAAGSPGAAAREALRACLDGAWAASRAVAAQSFIDARRPGRIVYLAPVSSAQAAASAHHADAARAGLENLARTLSIEWARYGITTVAIAPGSSTSADEVAALCAYLASPAGAYFSGCLLDLRGPAAAHRSAAHHS
jgi:NAD(P)-dependent dehydrogenase (short-subunit alcohol dehydrogenase family)